MRTSSIYIFVTLAAYAAAAPARRFTAGTNTNQGSARPVIAQADGSSIVDGIRAANDPLANQIACLLDEKDCISGGGSAASCANDRIGCQSGNGINGFLALLNAEPGPNAKRSVDAWAKRQFGVGQNSNQGSARPLIEQADGSAIVDGIRAANDLLGAQISCLLDEKDCLAGGGSASDCGSARVDCQSGNGINGLKAPLNND